MLVASFAENKMRKRAKTKKKLIAIHSHSLRYYFRFDIDRVIDCQAIVSKECTHQDLNYRIHFTFTPCRPHIHLLDYNYVSQAIN